MNIAFNFGNYPTYITATSPADAQSANVVYGFLLYGVGSILGSFLWGKIYDRSHGRLVILLLAHLVLVVVTAALLYIVPSVPISYTHSMTPLMVV